MAKIVHLTSVHPAFDIRIFYKECISLSASGHSVFLIVPHERDESAEGVTILSVPKPKNRLQRMVTTAYQIYKRAMNVNADIYHIHDSELLPFAQVLRLRGKKVIFDMHENLPLSIKTKPWISRPLRSLIALLYSYLERILLYKIPVIFAEISYRKNYSFVAMHETICNFPLFEKLTSTCVEKYHSPTVGYIGGVTALRGILKILEALKILEKKESEPNLNV